METSASAEWALAMDRAHRVHQKIMLGEAALVAQYVVPLAFRVRFVMPLNAREASTCWSCVPSPRATPRTGGCAKRCTGGSGTTRKHGGIAAMMSHVDHDGGDLERRDAETRSEKRGAAAAG